MCILLETLSWTCAVDVWKTMYLPTIVLKKIKTALLAYSSWMPNSRSCDLVPSPSSIIFFTFNLQIDKMAGIKVTDLTRASLI